MAVWCVGIDCDGNDNLHRWQTPRPIQAQYVNVYIYMMIHVRTILYTCLLTKNPPPKKMKRTSLHPVVSALRPSLPKGSEHLWASFPKQSLHFWCVLLSHRDVRHCYRKFMEHQEDSTWVKSSSLWQHCSLRIMAMSHQSPTT